MVRMPAKHVAVNDRFTAVVSVSSKDGLLMLLVEPIDNLACFENVSGRFTISAWREEVNTIRFSMRTEGLGTTAYLQGGLPLLAVAADLGLLAPL